MAHLRPAVPRHAPPHSRFTCEVAGPNCLHTCVYTFKSISKLIPTTHLCYTTPAAHLYVATPPSRPSPISFSYHHTITNTTATTLHHTNRTSKNHLPLIYHNPNRSVSTTATTTTISNPQQVYNRPSSRPVPNPITTITATTTNPRDYSPDIATCVKPHTGAHPS